MLGLPRACGQQGRKQSDQSAGSEGENDNSGDSSPEDSEEHKGKDSEDNDDHEQSPNEEEENEEEKGEGDDQSDDVATDSNGYIQISRPARKQPGGVSSSHTPERQTEGQALDKAPPATPAPRKLTKHLPLRRLSHHAPSNEQCQCCRLSNTHMLAFRAYVPGSFSNLL